MKNISLTFVTGSLLLFVSLESISAESSMDMHKDSIYSKLLIDRLEYTFADDNALVWDANLWIGGDYTRMMLKTEGEKIDSDYESKTDIVYSKLISPFWDFQAGLSAENYKQSGVNDSRFSVVAGLMGLAPYWFETDAMLYVSDAGDVSSSVEVEYEWLITQRTVLQARMESLIALQQVSEFGVEKGINFIEAGLRLRYEMKREFSPYLGFNFKQLTGNAADKADSQNNDDNEFLLLAGVRFWF